MADNKTAEVTDETVTAEVTPVGTPEQIAAVEAFAPFWEVYKNVSSEANALNRTFTDASKNAGEVIDNLLTTSDDEKIVAWRKFDDEIAAKIEAFQKSRDEAKASVKSHAETLVPGVTEVDLDATKSQYLDKRKAANLTGKNILALLGNDEALFKVGIEHYGITEVIGLSRNSQTTGATGIIRKRLASATIDGNDAADAKGKVSFTSLATALKVDGDVIREAAAKAANVESVKDIPNGTEVKFSVTSGDKTHAVTITTPSSDD